MLTGWLVSLRAAEARPGIDEQLTGARSRLLNLLIAAVFLTALVRRLAGANGENFVGTWSDDFYYYLKTAMNVAAGNGSTFDGEIPTNGYHPLWMLCIVGLVLLFKSGAGTLIPLSFIVAGTTAATFALSQRLAARVLRSDGVISIVIALYTTSYFYIVAKHGMEVIITIPLMMYAALRALRGQGGLESPRDALLTGLLASVIVLSRVDSVLFVALYVIATLTCRPLAPPALLRSGAYFLIGFFPVLVYLAFNIHYFGGLLPVSGAAKQLAVQAWRHPKFRGFEISDRLHLAFVFPVIAANALGLALATFGTLDEGKFERRVGLLPILIFPQVFYLLQISMNDWPFWDWYLYPWMAATPIVIAMSLQLVRPTLLRLDRAANALGATWLGLSFGAGALASLALAALDWRRPLPQLPIQGFAIALTAFAEKHPGRYAMGDRAGMVGFLLPFPLLQLEGLMEDRHFLDHVRNRDDLGDVLAEYRIDYYATTGAVPDGGCYRTTEPRQAGPLSPRMAGRFCSDPVLVFHSDFDHTDTLVFALKPSPR